MKINQIFCPNCGGSIKGDLSKDSVFCPYCGQQLAIDHEKHEVTINKNININKTENKTINNTIRHEFIDYTQKDNNKSAIFAFLILLAIIALCMFMSLVS